LSHLLDQLGERPIDRSGSADEHHVRAARELLPLPPIGFAQPAPHPIPARRLADSPADGKPDARATTPGAPERDERGTLLALPALEDLLNVLAAPEPRAPRQRMAAGGRLPPGEIRR